MSKASRSATGDGDPYSAGEEASLLAAIEGADEAWGEGARHPSGVDVEAQIEWSGSYMARDNGMRRTHLDGLSLAQVRAAVRRARNAPQRVRRSYNAKSIKARLRQLLDTKAGRQALADAGIPARTLRAAQAHYFRGARRAPSKKTQQRITSAYEAMRGAPMDQELITRQEARSLVVEALQDALEDRYGVTIRFRNIRHFRFE